MVDPRRPPKNPSYRRRTAETVRAPEKLPSPGETAEPRRNSGARPLVEVAGCAPGGNPPESPSRRCNRTPFENWSLPCCEQFVKDLGRF